MLIEEFGKIGRGEMNHLCKLRKGEILCMMLLNQAGDLGNSDRIAVLLHILRAGALHTEIVVHHIHKIVDVGAISQLVALLLVGVIFDKAGDQSADGIKGGIVALHRAVTEKVWVLRIWQ